VTFYEAIKHTLLLVTAIISLAAVLAGCGGTTEQATPPAGGEAAVAPPPETATVALAVTGMHCEGCAETITRALVNQPGVVQAAVTYQTGNGEVKYDVRQVRPEDLIRVIEKLGYGATPVKAETDPSG